MTYESLEIIQSLKDTNLLVGELPEAEIFERALFGTVDPNAILNFDQKLGHLYEDALEVLIQNSPLLELIASHVQIFDESKQTIGELDFIVFDKKNERHIHLELAVKFYLGIETSNGWKFPGPDQRDNWQRKLERLKNHQLILTHRSEAKAVLKYNFGIESIVPQQLIYGRLFSPVGAVDMLNPEGVSNISRRGRWLFMDQWNDHFNGVDEVLCIPKHLWPVEVNEATQSLFKAVSVTELKEMGKERCVMFCISGGIDPWFLVPNEWGTNL